MLERNYFSKLSAFSVAAAFRNISKAWIPYPHYVIIS